jgi:hypothetical protein
MLHVHPVGQSRKFLQAVYPLPVPDIEKLPLENIPAVLGDKISLVPFGADEIKIPEGEILFADNIGRWIKGRGREASSSQANNKRGNNKYTDHLLLACWFKKTKKDTGR